MEKIIITTEKRFTCPVCGERGTLLYNDLKDRLFDTLGQWAMKKCQNRDCDTLWLDPAPTEESIPALYDKYPTHNDAISAKSPRNKNLEKMRNTLLYKKYGYGQKPSLWDKLLKFIMYSGLTLNSTK